MTEINSRDVKNGLDKQKLIYICRVAFVPTSCIGQIFQAVSQGAPWQVHQWKTVEEVYKKLRRWSHGCGGSNKEATQGNVIGHNWITPDCPFWEGLALQVGYVFLQISKNIKHF